MANMYSFSSSLTPPRAPSQPPQNSPVAAEQFHEYSGSEFFLELPAQWAPVETSTDATFNFHSETDEAGISVSTEPYGIPDSRARAFAKKNIEARIATLRKSSSGRATVLQRTVQTHSGGSGLELSFAAEVPYEYIYIYLGYITSRKILNFSMLCKPDRRSAAHLFNKTVSRYRPRLVEDLLLSP